MPDLSEAFFECCTKHFSFLTEEMGFNMENTKPGSYDIVRFRGEKLVVECVIEWLDHYLYVNLFPQAEFPHKESFTRLPITNFKSSGYNLDTLLSLRAPDLSCRGTTAGQRLMTEDMDKVIACFASGLKSYGQDVLHGDLTVFPELEILVKENYKQRMREEEKKEWSFWDLFRR